MKNIQETIKKVTALLATSPVKYPQSLLRKHDLNKPFDVENLKYLTQGGGAGGYFQWLTLLMQNSDAKLIVELGNRYGSSTLAIHHGLKKSQRLVTIDTEHDQRYVTPEVFKNPQIDFVFGDCVQLNSFLKAGIQIPTDIDILWSDTIHYDEQVSAEFYVYEPLLADEALILVDDIHLNDKGKFFARMKYWKVDLAKECHGNGFGVIHYVRPANQRANTKEERIQEAIIRSSQVYQKRWLNLFENERQLESRLHTMQKERRIATIKRLLGPKLLTFINKLRN